MYDSICDRRWSGWVHIATGFLVGIVLATGLPQVADAAQADAQQIGPPGIWGLGFSPDGRWLAAATNRRGKGGPIVVWDTTTWSPRIMRFEQKGGLDVAFSPDGKLLAYSVRGPQVRLLDAKSGRLIRQIVADQQTVYAVQFTPDGKQLVTAGSDGVIRLWDVTSGSLARKLEGHRGTVYGLAVSPDGRTLLSGSDGGTARLWDLAEGTVKRVFESRGSLVRHVRFSRDGRYFLVSSRHGLTRLHEAASGRVVLLADGGNCADMTVREQLLATGGFSTTTGGFSPTVFIYRLQLPPPTEQQVRQIRQWIDRFEDEDYRVREAASLEILRMGLLAEPLLTEAMNSPDAEVRIRSRSLRRKIRHPEPVRELSGHSGIVEAVRFSPDEKLLATGCRGGELNVWSVPDLQQRATLYAPTRGN